MLVHSHSVDQAQLDQRFQDAIHKGGGHRQDDPTAGLQMIETSRSERRLVLGLHVFEHGEHRDRVKGFTGRKIVGKASLHKAEAVEVDVLLDVFVDSDSGPELLSEVAKKAPSLEPISSTRAPDGT